MTPLIVFYLLYSLNGKKELIYNAVEPNFCALDRMKRRAHQSGGVIELPEELRYVYREGACKDYRTEALYGYTLFRRTSVAIEADKEVAVRCVDRLGANQVRISLECR